MNKDRAKNVVKIAELYSDAEMLKTVTDKGRLQKIMYASAIYNACVLSNGIYNVTKENKKELKLQVIQNLIDTLDIYKKDIKTDISKAILGENKVLTLRLNTVKERARTINGGISELELTRLFEDFYADVMPEILTKEKIFSVKKNNDTSFRFSEYAHKSQVISVTCELTKKVNKPIATAIKK